MSARNATARPHRLHPCLVPLAVGVILLTSCGLPSDSHPHEISDRAITRLASPRASSTIPTTGTAASLYFVQSDHIAKVQVKVDGLLTANRVLTLLLKGPPDDAGLQNLTTSIPPGTRLRQAERSGATLRIDLSNKMKSIGGPALKNAYAQLVFTALDVPGVRRVRFAIEGDAIDAPTDDGNLPEIEARNYHQ